ncbi:MAG TPA: YegS/Rv2252/BmrU family lipid kinase [Anaerolineales bacterium]|nr:YegS/Rv2252/BmrU family lipid kinase [Anaerolineales bacterium]
MQFDNVFIALNPASGSSEPEEIRKLLEKLRQEQGWTDKIYEVNPDENLSDQVRAACKDGANLVVAAGGDGTVAGVINGLIGSKVPVGILPAGTGNGLARALGIPLELDKAVELLGRGFRLQPIDAMKVGDRYFVLNVSAGISSRAMSETLPEEKKSLGMLAYVRTIAEDLLDVKARRFNLTLDGHAVQVEAVEVLVANGEFVKEVPFPFGRPEYLYNGSFEVNIITASSVTEYVRLAAELLLGAEEESDRRDLQVHKQVTIDVEGEPMPVQADGEELGYTPVTVELVREALTVLVPEVGA